MKCRSCTLGEHYVFVPEPKYGDEPIPLVKCPFGEQVFHLESKRCCKIDLRRQFEGSDSNVEEDCETD